MNAITITHTRAEGTLVEGSRKGDGVYEILAGLRGNGQGNWRWSRNVGLYLGQSRDQAAQGWKIERAAAALRDAGHEVTVSVDDSVTRSFAEAEADRYGRAEARAGYHAEHAGRAAASADAAWQAERGILDFIPPGQPILRGHHSEGRHRRDLARADALMRRGIAETGRSEHHAERAAVAEQYQARRESVPTTLRRIKGLEADERSWERALKGEQGPRTQRDGWDGYKPAEGRYRERVETELAAVREQLAYWRAHVAAAEAAGVKIWTRDDFTKGDYVRFLGTWYEVLRVSGKSVTIPAMINDGPIVTQAGARCTWTDTIPYDKVTGRKSAAEMAELLAEVERREAQEAGTR